MKFLFHRLWISHLKRNSGNNDYHQKQRNVRVILALTFQRTMTLMGADISSIYLDYNATTPLRPEAIDAISAALGTPSNPSSVHQFGRSARLQVEKARQKVASLIGSYSEELTFTSGGTEANNLVL